MAEAAHPDLVDLVQCAVCLERFNEGNNLPKSLPCLHSFCVGCLKKYDSVKMGKIISCPTCRAEFPVPREGIESLPTSFVVLNLLKHVPEDTANQKSMKPIFCALHSTNNKCDFCCDECSVPLCPDCMVNVNKSEHKNHTIRKLKDVAEELDTKIVDTEILMNVMRIESEEKLEELEKILVFSRDGLKQQTKKRLDKVVSDANKWYLDTNSTIDKEFKVLKDKIHEVKEKVKEQQIKDKLQEVALMKNEGLIAKVRNSLAALNSEIEDFKTPSPSQWSASMGSLTEKVTLDMGQLTPSELKLPRVERLLFPEKPVIKFLCSSTLIPPCFCLVGLALNEAVVAYKGGKKVQKLNISNNTPSVVTETDLPARLDYNCMKYILSDGRVLLRMLTRGPSHILNNELNLIKTIQESYGRVIGAHSKQWVAFFTNGSLQIVDLEKNQAKKTVAPPRGITWSKYLSVCKNPDNEQMAVVDKDNKILVIYDGAGNLLHTCHLQFGPFGSFAVSCSRHHIYTSSFDPPGVHVYSWQGELLASMDREQLGMPEGHSVWNIHADGDKFVVATGPNVLVDSFKMYQCL